MSQDDDSSSSDEYLKHRALPVGDLPPDFDPHKPPTSAEEYLHQPTDENPDHWCQFCFGNAFQRSILLKQRQAKSGRNQKAEVGAEAECSGGSNEVIVPEPVDGQEPLLSILLNVRQTTLQNLMEWHVGWLEVAGFSEHQGKWLYSLLSCLEKPLTPELSDNVRKMVFLCSRARARLDSVTDLHLPQLNTLITIVTRFFNQEDLADQC
ncbi:Gemin2/Brr1 [Trinorchestia longiramus]|nr:Gemin2/Brr1 [Trinorchestia longiramus]